MTKLKWVIHLLRDLFTALWLYMPALIAISAIYYCLMAVDQGIDVLVQAGEHVVPALFTGLAIVFWSVLVWYSSRIVSYVRSSDEQEANIFVKHLPRFLAYHCFIAIQVAILALPSGCDIKKWTIISYIIIQSLYFIILTWAFEGKRRSVWMWLSIIFALIYVAILGWICYKACGCIKANHGNMFNDYKRHTFWLPFNAIGLFGVQVLMLWIYTNRRKGLFGIQVPSVFTRLLIWFGFSKDDAEFEDFYFCVFSFVSTIGLLFYFTSIFSLQFSRLTGPLAFTLLAFTVLVGVFNISSALSRKYDINVTLIVIIVAVLVSRIWSDPYRVHLHKSTQAFKNRLSVDRFVANWLHDSARYSEIRRADSGSPYIAYILLSDGGGARAGAWVGKVTSLLGDSTGGAFGRHLFSVAGASGGAVGNSAMYSLLKADMEGKIKPPNYSAHTDNYFKDDFLTYTLGRFLGPDFFRYLLRIPCIDDRGAALAKSFEQTPNEPVIAAYFAKDLDSVFDYSGHLPALFINSTSVEDGMGGIISNVKLSVNPRTDILNLLHNDSTLNFSTATILSARFPFVSPAGRIDDQYFVDGGYFDNSGAGTTLAFMLQVEKVKEDSIRLSKDTIYRLLNNVRFQVVHIHNSPVIVSAPSTLTPLENDLLTPIITLAGLQGSTTKMGNYSLDTYMQQIDSRQDSIVIDLYNNHYDHGDTMEETYPMSWINSGYQLQRMQNRLDSLVANKQSLLSKLIDRLK